MKHFYSQIKKTLNIALFLGIFLQNYSAKAQTTLLPGDILFTGYDSTYSATTGDAYSFVLLTNISAGTIIYFTDRGNFGSNSWQMAIPSDATVRWTSGTAIPAGTEILIKGFTASTYNPTTSVSTANGTVVGFEGGPTNGLSLSNVGDQIIAFQSPTGTLNNSASFIAGLQYNYCNANGGTTTANWDGIDCADGPNSSIIPPGLVGGTSAFYTGVSGTSVYTSGKLNTTLPLNTVANIRTAVMNPANWTLSTNPGTGTTLPSEYAFLSSPPAITSNPVSKTTCPGSNTTFTVVATNTTSYQWQVNTGSGFTDITNGAPYSGATTATLTITGATNAMSGYTYRCIATGSGTATSTAATLTVPTTITSFIQSQSNVSAYGESNGMATISVSGGTTPYFYSWSPSGGTASMASGLSAGTYTVTITDSTPNGLGGCSITQTVVITQPAGVTASTASLSPFTSCSGSSSTPQTFTVSGGSLTGNLLVSAPSGYEIGLSTNGSYVNNISFAPSGGNLSTVTIYARLAGSASGSPTGNITVSSPGAVTQNVAVTGTVNSTPAIISQPVSSQICTGANTTFSVTASNATGYQWQVNEGAGFTNIANGAPYSGATTATLTITGATAGLNGFQYRVIATGCTPSATSVAATLTINPSPSITAQPSNSTICSGANTTFAATASNATGYQWQVNDGSGFSNISNGTPYSGATTATLTITGATAAQNGYLYRVVVDGNCATSTNSTNAALTVNSAPVVTAQPAASTICAGANTTFTSTVSSATGYQWQVDQGAGFTNISNGAPYSGATTATLTITGATAGLNGYIYRVVATGACTPAATSNTAALTVNSAPAITAQPAASSICAGENTTFSATAANATGYQWQVNQGAGFTNISNGAPYSGATTATLTITGATAGLNGYLYRVIATGVCTPAATSNGAALTINSAPSITAQPSNSTICAGANTTFTATVVNATGYQWQVNEGAGFTNISNGAPYSGATTATLTVTSATAALNGYIYRVIGTGVCTPAATSNNATLTVNSAPAITTQPANITACIGSNTSFTAAASNATGYQWQVNQGLGYTNLSNNATYSGATTATLTITNVPVTANGYLYRLIATGSCTPAATSNGVSLTVPAINANATQVNVKCNGETNGSITLAPSGGTAPYTYLWSNNATTDAIINLAPGPYSVTITDANSCVKLETFTIVQPTALSATTSSTSVSCNGGSNGSASVSVSGGTPGYTYAWTPLGGTTSSITGRPAGNYTCTITDANGCILVRNITIDTPAPFVGTISKTDVSCNGGSNGTATIAASGATAPFTYSWSPTGGTAATASGLTAGTYTVTITDANTCVYQRTITVGQPDLLTVTSSKTDALCNGSATGTATVTPSGGNGNYTYQWRNASNTLIGTASTITGLVAGNYSCFITDGVGCFTTANFTIFQPSALTATTSQINATCTASGSATVTVSGGTPSYTYLWSPTGITTATATLPAGNHSCLITDANGCTITRNFTIGTTNTLVAVQSQTDVLCNGSNTGSAAVIPSGAPGPFTYVWSPAGGNADTATNLAAGNYSVTITSANGCSIVKNFTITQPTALVLTPSQTNILCNGANTGQASVSVTGGVGAYTYSWSPSGGTAATATGLTAGTYVVTVTDSNLCQKTQSFTIAEPTAIAITPSQTNVLCKGEANGTAAVTVTGGTGTYTYAWAPFGGNAATATALTAGTYTVTVTDANLCTKTETITITEPDILAATFTQTNVSCKNGNDGTATVTATGGTGTYTYSWAPSGGTAATATGLTAGTYIVTVTDTNSCTTTQTVTITEPTALAVTKSQIDVSCKGEANGTAAVIVTGGTGAYTYSWAPSGGTAATASGLTAGTYTVTITDANSCSTTETFNILEPTALTASANIVNVSCHSGNNGSASVIVSGGTGAYTYLWSTGGTSTSISGLTAGNYNVIVTDANACALSLDIVITEPQLPVNLVTAAAANITVSGAGLSGTVSSDGINRDKGECLTEVGFVYASNTNPTINDTKINSGSALGTFTTTLSGLRGNRTYYVRTYAINSNGFVNYGNEISFTTQKYTLNITASAGHTKVYGTPDPAFNFTASGFANGDTSAIITGLLSRDAGENVGKYNIKAGTISAGADYIINFTGAEFEITKANQTITWNQNLDFGCSDSNQVTFTATTDSGLPVSYTIANTALGTITGSTLNITGSGSSTITASQNGDQNHNAATAVVKPIEISQSGLIVQQWADVLFFDNKSTNFVSYQWYKNGTAVSGATKQYYTEVPLNGSYYVIAKDKNGNSIKSCPIEVSGTVFTKKLKIYPNPVRALSEFTLECDFSESQLNGAVVNIFDLTGKLVQTVSNVKNKNQITAPAQTAIYVIVLKLSNNQIKTINLLVK